MNEVSAERGPGPVPARAFIRSKPTSRSRSPRRKEAKRIEGAATRVRPATDLEVEMVAPGCPGVADVSDDLTSPHRRATRGLVSALMRVTSRQRHVRHAGVIPVAASPFAQDHGAVCSCLDRGASRRRDVHTRVVMAATKLAEAASERPSHGPSELIATRRRLRRLDGSRSLDLEPLATWLRAQPVARRNEDATGRCRAGYGNAHTPATDPPWRHQDVILRPAAPEEDNLLDGLQVPSAHAKHGSGLNAKPADVGLAGVPRTLPAVKTEESWDHRSTGTTGRRVRSCALAP